jgi:2-polyprenyl-3-methyl-5-hydroxy-6-metoxy-1,4-benzoquinol methylase
LRKRARRETQDGGWFFRKEEHFMSYENDIELYEAVYFFNRFDTDDKLVIHESIYNAVIRILVVNNLLDYDYNGNCFVVTDENKEKHRYIHDNIINKYQNNHYAEMFDKAVGESPYFFDRISELEYEIYSRYNFPVTFETGKEVVRYVDLADKKVLELGGNSGGLGTAILKKYKDCIYTIVDTKIPCMVGNEFKESNRSNITFIEGNVFDLTLPSEVYDYIIIMNLFHDFDDIKCLDILRNCMKYCDGNTKFLIIEDILSSEFEPKEVIMHGLRLAVNCRGGKQRTIGELVSLFLNVEYRLEKTIRLNDVHTMVVMVEQ